MALILLGEYAGVPARQRPRLRSWCAIVAACTGAVVPEEMNRLASVEEEMAQVLAAAMAESDAPADRSRLCKLAHSLDGPDATAADHAALLRTMMPLLYDGVLHLVGNGVLALLRRPAHLAWLLRDPHGRVAEALEELLADDPGHRLAVPLARRQAEVAVASVLQRCSGLRLAIPLEGLAWLSGPWGERPAHLPLVFTPELEP
jgi:cytochrome P450